MNSQDPIIQYFLQFGGLGLAAYMIWWVTKKLNGKIDALTEAVQRNADTTHQLIAALERYRYLMRRDVGPVDE